MLLVDWIHQPKLDPLQSGLYACSKQIAYTNPWANVLRQLWTHCRLPVSWSARCKAGQKGRFAGRIRHPQPRPGGSFYNLFPSTCTADGFNTWFGRRGWRWGGSSGLRLPSASTVCDHDGHKRRVLELLARCSRTGNTVRDGLRHARCCVACPRRPGTPWCSCSRSPRLPVASRPTGCKVQ
jgi:hypothetical protein